MDHAEQSGSPWSELSAVYDRQLRLERRAVAKAVDLARAGPGEALLDAGTGTGAVLRELAARKRRPRVAVGVDASRAMLARVPPLPPGWRLERAGVERLPFEAATFDVAIASYLLHVLPSSSRQAALGELRRVLCPGGRLVIVTPVIPARALTRPLWLALGGLARSWPRRWGGLAPLDPRPELAAAGFRLESAVTVRGGYYSLCVSALAPKRPPGQGTPA